ncbi:Hypothetical predicted protein [Olea europaea subsp. europaea]|uniref:Uncharacterized protein n=1 Tax=Olea europaea subsp. europaea TaxID=158383 RepID=A0A8S0R0I6_OLEEU|nr:Hypothetical predicted protein [Olea europaea subsp. europaea]
MMLSMDEPSIMEKTLDEIRDTSHGSPLSRMSILISEAYDTSIGVASDSIEDDALIDEQSTMEKALDEITSNSIKDNGLIDEPSTMEKALDTFYEMRCTTPPQESLFIPSKVILSIDEPSTMKATLNEMGNTSYWLPLSRISTSTSGSRDTLTKDALVVLRRLCPL